jgi:hypothetical protein
MRALWTALAVAGLLTTTSALAAGPTAPTLAVLPLRAEGLQLNEANRLNLMLRARASTRSSYAVQGEDLTTQLVEASQGLGIDCDVNAVSCAVEIGKIADAAFVVVGRAAKQTGVTVDGVEQAPAIGLQVLLVDVQAGREVRAGVARLPIDLELQRAQIDALSDVLFGEVTTASITIDVAPANSRVSIDGVQLGTTPLAPVRGVLPGEHVIVVEQKGFLPITRVVTAAREPMALALTLVVDPDAERVVNSPVVPFVVAGVGGALGIAGGVLMAIGAQLWFDLQDRNAELDTAVKNNNGQNDPAFVTTVTELNAKSQAAAANWNNPGQQFFVVGAAATGIGVLALAGGVVWGTVLLTSDAE